MKNRKETGNLHPVHQTNDGYFNTVSGNKISIHDPQIEMINVEDISHALSNLCRFGGHSSNFYSVAQHSVLVKDLAYKNREPRDVQFAALMHDATEAYCQDIIKPLKNIIGASYECIESRFEKVIAEKYSINPNHFKYIKRYDRMALEIEHEYFFHKIEDRFLLHCPTGHLLPIYAKTAFLEEVSRFKKEVQNG